VSELGELLAGIDKIRLRQSRAIARAVDRQRAALAQAEMPADETGYDFAVAVVAAATDRSPAEIEEMVGSILELGAAVQRIMALAGFVMGEAPPAASPPSASSSDSGAPSLPAVDIPPPRSAR